MTQLHTDETQNGSQRIALPSRRTYVRDSCVHELFAAAANVNPDQIALVGYEGSLTYAELLQRARGIALRLRCDGVGSGSLVGLAAGRSFSTLATILGTLMAGAAYIPFDYKGSPAGLLERQAANSKIKLLLCDEAFDQFHWEFDWWGDCELRRLSEIDVPSADRLPGGVYTQTSPLDPVSVMYTSGSLGQPKGVIVPHRAVARLVSAQHFLNFGPDETFLLHSPLSFDASTLELWGSLLHGARLAVAPARTLSVDDYNDVIQRYAVTTLWLSAPVFHLIADHKPEVFAPLHNLLVGGDVVNPQRVEKIVRLFPRLNIINGYGPTENTTFTTCYRVPRGYRATGSLPIGRAIAHTRIYILDHDLQPVANGEPGQLVTGGDGVALGYLSAPELTEERFVRDTFSNHRGALLYVTGDKVRRLPDGNLEFLGRFDREVKIAGHRIDLKGIEQALAWHTLVRQCAVVLAENGSGKKICAFVELRRAEPEAAKLLREHLTARLPEAALPSRFIVLESMPLCENGKIDRAALSARLKDFENPQPEPVKTQDAFSDVEAIWQRLLRRDAVDAEENFFDAGGNSLLLMEMHAELNKIYPGKVALIDLFSATTVAQISDRVAEGGPGLRICGGNATNGTHGRGQ